MIIWKWIQQTKVKTYKFWEMGLGLILPDTLWHFPLTGPRSPSEP